MSTLHLPVPDRASGAQHDALTTNSTVDALPEPSQDTNDAVDLVEGGEVAYPVAAETDATPSVADQFTTVLHVLDRLVPTLQRALRVDRIDSDHTLSIAFLRELAGLIDPILDQDERDFSAKYGVVLPPEARRARWLT